MNLILFLNALTLFKAHYKDLIVEMKNFAEKNKYINNKCTQYWTIFNAFYFSVTGITPFIIF